MEHYFYLQISYSSGLAALSDRSRFLRYFRNSPTFEIVSPALHSVMDHFKWQRIALLTQRESIFTGVKLMFLNYFNMTTIIKSTIIIRERKEIELIIN